MRSEFRMARYWLVVGGAFVGAASFILFAAALLLQALNGHGSGAGNILRVALAIFSLVIGLLFIIAGGLYLESAGQSRDSHSR